MQQITWWSLAAGVLLLYALFTVVGALSCFRGTYLGRGQRFLTRGSPWASGLSVRALGRAGAARLERACDICLSRAGPLLQFVYVGTVAMAYYLYAKHIFGLLPHPGAPLWHQWTGAAVMGITLLAFGAASVSNPGVITPANHQDHIRLYGGAAVDKRAQCNTCNWQRPARSRHCTICKRCIARFDHHCTWINNCVGFLNLRFFLLFLAMNSTLTGYAAALAAVVLKAEMSARRVWDAYRLDPSTSRLVPVRRQPRLLVSWLMQHHGLATMLTAFLALAWVLSTAFLLYHLWLLAHGLTTYDTFRQSKSCTGPTQAMAHNTRPHESQEHKPRCVSAAANHQSGWHNVYQVLLPYHFLRDVLRHAST